jgi:hypothetical protein
LVGTNEVPPNTSAATGTITFTFDQSTSKSTWTETFSGLSAPATAAHIHSPAPPGSNAAIQVPFTGVPAATSGSYSGSTTTINTETAAQFANDLLTGMAYANIHTSIFPGGEIRGQLSCHTIAQSVPEFSGALGALTIAALLLPLIAVLRRQSLASLK